MEDRRRDGGTKFILKIKEQETRLTLQEHDDDDDDDDDGMMMMIISNHKYQCYISVANS